jgi:RNA polymerase sigma-54 factor
MQQTTTLEHRQQQTISPRLQHAVRLLQMSSLEYAQSLNDAISRNPFLEPDEPDNEAQNPAASADDPGSHLQEQASEVGLPPLHTDAIGPDDFSSAEEPAEQDGGRFDEPYADAGADGEREPWVADGTQTERRGEGSSLSALDLVPAQPGLRAHLHGQLNLLPLPERDLALAKAVVESLDDDGYLRQPLEDLMEDSGLEPPPSEDECRIALCRVQSLDPAGVGARSVAECLLLQIPGIEDPDEQSLARRIVSDHLDCLAAKDMHRLTRLLGSTLPQVMAACDRIRRLDPHPGWRFDASQAHYISPDILVKKVRGQWTATLNPAVVPRLRVNQVYAEMFQRHRQGNNAELSAHLQEARWTLRNIEQRFSTILSVAQAIIGRQRRFFDLGALAMKPLCLKEIAAEVGLHESTVSRVTNNKYMATPMGVFELKYFFSRPMAATEGRAFSATAIRELIKDMIAAEDAASPLSDAEIARLLARQGLEVARRTVTKYRQALRIEAVERRRAA